MAAPPKPWESPGINHQHVGGLPTNPMSSLPSGLGLPSTSALGNGNPTVSTVPPPVPSRPSQQSSLMNRYSPMSSSLGGFGYGSGLGGYGYSSPYSAYSGYGYGGGYNRLGYGSDNYSTSTFARQAEENSRPAFQSIESIVQAFTSVSMMLDSSFQAVYNSFRAVIGVADNFSRLRTQLVSAFSALAFIRTLRYLYRRLLVILGLRPPGYAEEAWSQAADVVGNLPSGGDSSPKKSSWPILMFFGIILGAPWLIWKLICSFSNVAGANGWARGEEDHFVAQALFEFRGDTAEELTFRAGQTINVAPKELQPRVKGWLLASVDGTKTGLIPANYVKILGKRRGQKPQSVTDSGSPLQTDTGPDNTGQEIQPEMPAENSLNSVFEEVMTPSSAQNYDTAQMNAEDILEEKDITDDS